MVSSSPSFLALSLCCRPLEGLADPCTVVLWFTVVTGSQLYCWQPSRVVLGLNMEPQSNMSHLGGEWPLNRVCFSCACGLFSVTAILDIPFYKSRVQSLHLLFSLYSEFKNSQVRRQRGHHSCPVQGPAVIVFSFGVTVPFP